MSQPAAAVRRYSFSEFGDELVEMEGGAWVEAKDYDALHAQAVALAREVERIKGNGSPCTDFGRGVIAACEDIETFIKQQAQALLEGR